MHSEILPFRERCLIDLISIDTIFKQFSIPFFAMFGTALGALREKDFIDRDYDIDIGIIQPNLFPVTNALTAAFTGAGFTVSPHEFQSGKITLLKRNVLTGLSCLQLKDNAYYCFAPNGRLQVRIPGRYLSKFVEMRINRTHILVPDPPEPYIQASYGTTWRTPDINHHAKTIIDD